jgi:hypothetical protein
MQTATGYKAIKRSTYTAALVGDQPGRIQTNLDCKGRSFARIQLFGLSVNICGFKPVRIALTQAIACASPVLSP